MRTQRSLPCMNAHSADRECNLRSNSATNMLSSRNSKGSSPVRVHFSDIIELRHLYALDIIELRHLYDCHYVPLCFCAGRDETEHTAWGLFLVGGLHKLAEQVTTCSERAEPTTTHALYRACTTHKQQPVRFTCAVSSRVR